ncbi:kinesin-domain-containing protein [Thelephora terrestris]|uniref:Kinesin-domain-containing protein n=1 Tax=Thelephora terrestris TaxID=56493 RepID=A0A9P6H771_9AGAM|nr:kinesin-domain-containing protein [Thelephora terrestris]
MPSFELTELGTCHRFGQHPHLTLLPLFPLPPPLPYNPYIPASLICIWLHSPRRWLSPTARQEQQRAFKSVSLPVSPTTHIPSFIPSNPALRIRPTNNHDIATIPPRFQRTIVNPLSATSVSVDPLSANSAQNSTPSAPQTVASKKQQFTFDQVHGPNTTQHAVFTSTANPLISRFLEGFNCTILAYGQTSSGKTHTMTGIDLDANPTDPDNGMGIIPRAVATIFARARELREERAGAWNFNIKGSFIEIYNEDLLDLLADEHSANGRRDVQIREDKRGTIIWDGLREVNVKNTPEVMTLLRKGTSIRRTNETDMNAQSSRSHAIFSLTLIQKKYVGTNPLPPRSSSPLPPGGPGRSPSRLARPGSMIAGPSNRVSSPTPGRPGTPSFSAALNRSSLQASGLRPPSSLGFHHADHDSAESIASADGDWVTVVSKFHFVDLAGSERLKRTAAQGDRIKEGISINSGLLALGNVISALGDPSRVKSNTASYVPYRDSKLTRLLQDSLGGNAHTLMIACVSPTEWNAAETINTLKYANRARNIKNRAVVNEREEGWDDVEWLQNMVTRLRKELKGLKEGGPANQSDSGAPSSFKLGHTPASSIATITSSESHTTPASGRMLAQMAELRNNYEDLREQFTQRTEELTRLRRELAEKSSRSSNVGGQMNRYEEIVGPVIEEYEKTISAMEAELSLNRAALRHTNEMYDEKEEEFSTLQERHSATEMYVEELRSRAARLAEREASTEASLLLDLEERLKQYDESSLTSSESMGSLKREITQYKEAETHSAQYIADLESRLLRADESILDLQQAVEHLEKEAGRRREEVEVLQNRLTSLAKDGQSWRDDLEEREERVKDLERKMIELETKKNDAAEERARLGEIVEEVAKARRSLQLPKGITINGSGLVSVGSSRPDTPVSTAPPSETPQTLAEGNADAQLLTLQQTHTATLADLSNVTAKYRDALREIQDLSSQLEEVKLSQGLAPSESLERSGTLDTLGNTSGAVRRKPVRNTSDGSGTRRPFFRHAASAESLHSSSFSSRPNLSISVSPSSLLDGANGVDGSAVNSGKSAASLEKEIMRLQDVLKEREAEIALLEESLKASETKANHLPAAINDVTPTGDHSECENRGGRTTPVSSSPIPSVNLSPKTMNQFRAIRSSLDFGEPDGVDSVPSLGQDNLLERLNELMRSMAQKESSHKEVVDDLNGQLYQVKKQHDELQTLSRDQIHNMSAEIEAIGSKHTEALAKLEEVACREAELTESIRKAQETHAAEVEALRAQHAEALKLKEVEVDELINRLKAEHEEILLQQLAAAAADLEKAHKDHAEAFGKLKAEHEEELKRRDEEIQELLAKEKQAHEESLAAALASHASVISLKDNQYAAAQKRLEEAEKAVRTAKSEHSTALEVLAADHAVSLKAKDSELSEKVAKTEEEHYDVLTKLRQDHSEAIERQVNEASIAMERLKEEHASQLQVAEISRDGSLSESQSAQEKVIRELREAHSKAISQKEANFTQDLERLKAEHEKVLSSTVELHTSALEKARSDHAAALSKLQAESQAESTRLGKLVEDAKAGLAVFERQVAERLEASQKDAAEQQVLILQEVERGHEQVINKLKGSHQTALREAERKALDEQAKLHQSHLQEVDRLKEDHTVALAELKATLLASHTQDRQDFEAEVERQHQSLIDAHSSHVSELESNAQELADLNRSHEGAIAQLLSDQQSAAENRQSALAALEAQHLQAIEKLRTEHGDNLTREQEKWKASIAELEARHNQELSSITKELTVLSSSSSEATALHERYLQDLAAKESELKDTQAERDDLALELSRLREELEKASREQSTLLNEAAKRQSLVDELEKHRSVLAETQEWLQKVKDEKDAIQLEKNKQEALLRDLQVQVTRSPSPPNNTPRSRQTMIPPAKPPPPTPPPSIPPPPAPRLDTFATASPLSTINSMTSSRELNLDSPATPATSLAPSLQDSTIPAVDPKVVQQLDQQTKTIGEQAAMIKTLNKQLTHCESDLQTHMDEVNRLENTLADSEKNLRKARMHATELARERDSLNAQMASLRNDLEEAKREVTIVRRSVVEEKQSLENRLDEERRAKERVRAQLDSRMEEVQKRKSKFVCL